jgi:glycosyltransferase involved in cell wall biosynthesis
MGIDVLPNLHLHRAPVQHPGLAGLWFRWNLKRWWNGPQGVIIARDKRRLLTAIEQYGLQEHRLVLETHELDSQTSTHERDGWFTIEQQCLAHADALVANCGGTLGAWKAHHKFQNQTVGVVHNATHILSDNLPSTIKPPHMLVLGSMRPSKGVQFILHVAERLPCPLHWVGGTAEERERVDTNAHLILQPAVSHQDIETTLGNAAVLLLPLGHNPFSQTYTSPLKLWDYLATNKPIVAANTPAIMEISRLTGTPFHLYEPEDEQSLQRAVRAALNASPRSPYTRTWTDRAQELVEIVEAMP